MFHIITDVSSKIPNIAFPRERVAVVVKFRGAVRTGARCFIPLTSAYNFSHLRYLPSLQLVSVSYIIAPNIFDRSK